jgi:hypothetical protein
MPWTLLRSLDYDDDLEFDVRREGGRRAGRRERRREGGDGRRIYFRRKKIQAGKKVINSVLTLPPSLLPSFFPSRPACLI